LGQWAQSSGSSTAPLDRLTDILGQLSQCLGNDDRRQSIQIAVCDLLTHLRTQRHINHSLAKGPFLFFALLIALLVSFHLKSRYLAKCHFGPQYLAFFVIHLAGAVRRLVPNAYPFGSLLEMATGFPGIRRENAGSLGRGSMAQKAQHILAMKMFHGMPNQQG